jgi:alkylhydroperoxidase family enzyme
MHSPSALRVEDLAPLRKLGLDDRAIVDANHFVAYFNYVDRIAAGLGVEREPHRRGRRVPLALG